MPELPEVETVCRGLANSIIGHKIIKVELNRPDLRYPFPNGLAQMLQGYQIEAVTRRAKYLLIHIGTVTLIGHLGMSGRYVVRKQGLMEPHRHDHMVWHLENGTEVVYHDPRRFGFLLMAKRGEERFHPMLAELGVEPFSDDFHATYLVEKLSARQAPIKQVLLDQRVIAGLGNIYVSEALFRLGIHPVTSAALTVGKALEMVEIIRQVLQEAIDSGGSTLRNYANAIGDTGYFQHTFRVYGREGEPCLRCATPISRLVQAGRSSFFCPSCQMEKQ